MVTLALLQCGCGGGSDLASNPPLSPGDPSPPPTDTTPPVDTTSPPTTPNPPDTTAPPPPIPPPPPPGPPPVHVGIPIGPAQQPVETWTTEFNSTVYVPTPGKIIADLETARRYGLRTYVSFTGGGDHLIDDGGFSIEMWKKRVDRFRGLDLTPYINDGTIIGHFLLDEPSDPSNWNGHIVPKGLVEEMAKYSKQVWPTMVTVIRAWPDYLKGGQYPDLDAVRVQYHVRFGDIDAFIKKNAQEAKDLGLSLVGGLNVARGGGAESGLPPDVPGRYPMNATQVRTFGTRFLSEPDLCGFVMWEYRKDYFKRPDIRSAMQELTRQAANLPNRPCRHL